MILTKGIEAKNSVELITKNISCTLILALTSIFYWFFFSNIDLIARNIGFNYKSIKFY